MPRQVASMVRGSVLRSSQQQQRGYIFTLRAHSYGPPPRVRRGPTDGDEHAVDLDGHVGWRCHPSSTVSSTMSAAQP